MSATEQSVDERLVRVKAGSATLEGNLNLPGGRPCSCAVCSWQRK